MSDFIPSVPSGPHPTPEELYAARHGTNGANAASRESVLGHAALCAPCSVEEFQQEAFDTPGPPVSVRSLDAGGARFGEPSSRSRRRIHFSGAPVVLALAASFVLAVGLGGTLLWRNRAAPDEVRGGMPVGQNGWPTGEIAKAPDEIRFVRHGAAPVRVIVFDGTRGTSWTSASTLGTRVVLPAADRARMRPGVDYFWTVLGDDQTPEARRFRIREK